MIDHICDDKAQKWVRGRCSSMNSLIMKEKVGRSVDCRSFKVVCVRSMAREMLVIVVAITSTLQGTEVPWTLHIKTMYMVQCRTLSSRL